MNRRKFLAFLGSLPLIGLLVPKATAEAPVDGPGIHVGKTAPDPLPDHFPKNLVVIDEKGQTHPVTVAVVNDGKYPDKYFTTRREPNKWIFDIHLPLVTVSQDGLIINVFAYHQEDFNQISEQLLWHYNQRIESIADNLKLDDYSYSEVLRPKKMPDAFCIIKWRIHLREMT